LEEVQPWDYERLVDVWRNKLASPVSTQLSDALPACLPLPSYQIFFCHSHNITRFNSKLERIYYLNSILITHLILHLFKGVVGWIAIQKRAFLTIVLLLYIPSLLISGSILFIYLYVFYNYLVMHYWLVVLFCWIDFHNFLLNYLQYDYWSKKNLHYD
jgi:hypothetical protein